LVFLKKGTFDSKAVFYALLPEVQLVTQLFIYKKNRQKQCQNSFKMVQNIKTGQCYSILEYPNTSREMTKVKIRGGCQ
jgi:hypothetical protein